MTPKLSIVNKALVSSIAPDLIKVNGNRILVVYDSGQLVVNVTLSKVRNSEEIRYSATVARFFLDGYSKSGIANINDRTIDGCCGILLPSDETVEEKGLVTLHVFQTSEG